MYTRSYSELTEALGKSLPSHQFHMHLGVLYVDDDVASIVIDNGYRVNVPRSNHRGTYTDVASLIVGLQQFLDR